MPKPEMEMDEGGKGGFPFGGKRGKRGGRRKKSRKGRKSSRY